MWIGITGKKRSGKDTLARFLPKEYKRIAFADAIKEKIRQRHSIEEPEDKEALCLYDSEGFQMRTSYRELCQRIGQEFRRLDPNFWIKQLRVTPTDNVVFTDVRFDNEADFIRNNDGFVIHVSRETGLVDNDVSERGISTDKIDLYIDNNKTLSDFEKEAETLFAFLLRSIDHKWRNFTPYG